MNQITNNTPATPENTDILQNECMDADRPFQKVILLGLDTGAYDAERSMAELSALCEANFMESVAEVLQKRATPVAATVLGSGRVEEAQQLAETQEAETAVFDGELTGSQIRNLEKALGIPVIDRTMLILEIFKSRATSAEGKTQTELASLEYRLPRLSGLGSSLSRQGGGGGGGAGARRGGGETKLEYDRRYIRSRISLLKKRLAAMEKARGENRRAREKSGIPVIAVVGYTNVGKSSLVNTLVTEGSTKNSDAVKIPVADMLFATLDPSARSIALPDGQTVIVVDTVGFVSRLPHNLVEAFKSTLEEAVYADLVLYVCDASDEDAQEQLNVTRQVLASLGCENKPSLTVYNKIDKAEGFSADIDVLAVSAKTGTGIDRLLAKISEKLSSRVRSIKVLLPYTELAAADTFRKYGTVTKEDFRDDGVYMEGSIMIEKLHVFQNYLTR